MGCLVSFKVMGGEGLKFVALLCRVNVQCLYFLHVLWKKKTQALNMQFSTITSHIFDDFEVRRCGSYSLWRYSVR